MTVSEIKPVAILAENAPREGASRVRFSPLRVGVFSRLILVALLAAVLWTAITWVIKS
jgi:hypothetical protein